MSHPIEIFCCYAREDQEMLARLMKHLMPLQKQGLVTIWSDKQLNAGMEWEAEIHHHLNSAGIILLLISPDFMSSDYCYDIEMKRAIEHHNQGSAHVILILLRSALWNNAPFAKLQVLPEDARPVNSWPDSDEAFTSIATYISQIVTTLQAKTDISTLSDTTTITSEQALGILHAREENLIKTSPYQETGTLIVWTNRENRGNSVYLLPSDTFYKCKSSTARDNHILKIKGTITALRIEAHLLFITRFRDLQPGRYRVWIGYGAENPQSVAVEIQKGGVSELELDWKN